MRKSVIVAIVATALVFLAAPASLSRSPDIWGIDLPRGSERVLKYRSVAIYKLHSGPESAHENISRRLRTKSGVKTYTSRVGNTVLIFIEDTSGREWSSIQISGVTGKSPTFVTVTTEQSDSSWNWKRRGGDYTYR